MTFKDLVASYGDLLPEPAAGGAALPARHALAAADPFTLENVEAALREVVEATAARRARIFQPVRVAIAGTTVSPGIFESVTLLGREETLARIDKALDRARSA